MKPGTYGVRWCDGSRDGITSVREAMKLARAKSGQRFATGTCGPGSHVVLAVTHKTAKAVAECRERSCTPFRLMSQRKDSYYWSPAKATAAFKQQRGLRGARRKRKHR